MADRHRHLEVAMVRIPCNDFKNWQRLNGYDDRAWVKRFAAAGAGSLPAGRPGGRAAGGRRPRVVHQPGHGVTVSTMFRALTTERALLPELLQGRRPRRGRGAARLASYAG